MPIAAQLANIWIGQEPPTDPNPRTRWISTSARHLQVPQTPFERKPIIGSYVGNASATQEMSPWYNPTLQRYECLVNTSGSQKFWWANDPENGPWQGGTQVLGGGSGGEASNAQQCSVYVEGTTLYAVYLKSAGATVVTMATAAMPTTAAGTPVFSVNGTVYDNLGATILDSSYLTKINGTYMLVAPTGGAPRLTTSASATAAGLVAAPFIAIGGALKNMYFNVGGRFIQRLGRPQLFYENGTAIMFGHFVDMIDGLGTLGITTIYRFTCNDPFPNLVNWVADPVARPFMEQLHPAEIDQIADFRLFQGANEAWFAFWTGTDNVGTKFTVMAAKCREPMLAFGGFDWQYTQNIANDGFGPGYINPDWFNYDVIAGNGSGTAAQIPPMADAVFRTTAASLKATFAPAASHQKVKITNVAASPNSINMAHLVPNNATDQISDGNPLTAVTRVATAVTLAFRYPTDYDANDFLCITGMTPTGYNTTAQAITSVSADKKTVVYTLAVDPGANTVMGAVARSVRNGESRAYKARVQGIWVRD